MSVKSVKFFFILLCLAYHSRAQITLLPVFSDTPIKEDMWFVTKNKDSIQFDNIRFYLSNIEFEKEDKLIIKDAAKAHLMDIFEPNTLQIALKNIDFNKIKTMRFNIGIDSLTNVSGALGGDLDPQKGMYWAWQSGYINMKIEGRSPQCKNRKNVFQYHMGGYLSPFYSMRSVELAINAQNSEGVSDIGALSKSDNPNSKYTEGVILQIDFSKFFENINIAAQNSIMMPCEQAMELADYSVQMFSVKAHEK